MNLENTCLNIYLIFNFDMDVTKKKEAYIVLYFEMTIFD